ncbi:MAG: sodium-dependent transporter [Gemmatimonas sp.]|nr:sodium-dependent transporter [Gemmatimonas sp.]
MTQTSTFTSRWGMMLAMLGMAVGTGNIWRFPRIAAANGGGAFLVAWVCFLLLWSVPLLLVEFSMGKAARRGTVGAFSALIGKRYAWMGAWVAFTATAIMFYYSVVAGWTIRYFFAGITGELEGEVPGALWTGFAGSGFAVAMHAVAMAIGVFVVARGVRGIEKAAGFLIPSLFGLVVLLAVRAVTLPGAEGGLVYLFTPNWADLGRASIWLEALTQNAWDTGAGWGLALSYAIYMRQKEDTTLNSFMLGFGNNSVSLLAGIMVICTVFAVGPAVATQIAATPTGFEQAIRAYPGLEARLEAGLTEAGPATVGGRAGIQLSDEDVSGFFRSEAVPIETRLAVAREAGVLDGQQVAEAVLGSGNNGLTFIWVPQIFDTLPFGRVLTSLFFLALAFAAISSLIAMIELATRVLVDAGVARGRAVATVGGIGFLMGIPSALSMAVFDNQDFVWGVGLMLSGFFFAFAVARFGVERFRQRFVNTQTADIRIGAGLNLVLYLVMAQAVILMGWWLYQAIDFADLGATFTPLSPFSVGTLLVQWGIALAVLISLNGWLARRTPEVSLEGDPDQGDPALVDA